MESSLVVFAASIFDFLEGLEIRLHAAGLYSPHASMLAGLLLQNGSKKMQGVKLSAIMQWCTILFKLL